MSELPEDDAPRKLLREFGRSLAWVAVILIVWFVLIITAPPSHYAYPP